MVYRPEVRSWLPPSSGYPFSCIIAATGVDIYLGKTRALALFAVKFSESCYGEIKKMRNNNNNDMENRVVIFP